MNKLSQLALISVLGVVCMSISACTVENSSIERELEGVWALESYRLPEHELDVSGLMIISGQHFALSYNMQRPDGPLSARSHAGPYRVSEDNLVFDVQWWVEEVDGTSDIVAPLEEAASMRLDGDILELSFGGGSMQRWRRLEPGVRHGSEALRP